MSKLHKIEMYILDIDEYYGGLKDTIEHINDRLELVSLHPFNVQSVEFDWNDEHKLNFTTAEYEDFRGFFPKESEDKGVKLSEEVKINQDVIDALCEQLGLEEDEISLESKLMDDLGADSLDLVELEMILEEKLDLSNHCHGNDNFNCNSTVKELIDYVISRKIALESEGQV